MNDNKFVPAIVGGFAAAVLSTVPGLKNAACCLFIPLATVFSIFLYRKINRSSERIKPGTGLYFGLLTGAAGAIFSTAFDLVITFLAKTNDFVQMLPQTELALRELNLGAINDQTMELLRVMAKQITETGFSPYYTIGIFISNMVMYIIFGMLGGLLSTLILNRKSNTPQ